MLLNKKILILGAGEWQSPFITKAKTIGCHVLATDWSENAIGGKYADEFRPIDLKDQEGSLAFALEGKIEAIFTSADVGVPTAAFIAEKMGLRFHPPQLALMATNKILMRNRAKEIGISIPLYSSCETISEAIVCAKKIGYPVIIKPVDNCSSRGVFFVKDENSLRNIFYESLSSSLSQKILIEEFMLGTEGSVECIIHNGVPVILGICDKIKSDLPYRYDLQLNYPGNYSNAQYLLINEFINKLVRGFNILHGIIHVEIMVTESQIRLIEFALRPCGSKVVTHLIPTMTGFDVNEYLLYDSFGIEKEIEMRYNKIGLLKFIMLDYGKIKSIRGVKEARGIKGIIDLEIERKAGDIIGETKDGRSRPGYLLAVADTINRLNSIVDKALSKIKVEYQA